MGKFAKSSGIGPPKKSGNDDSERDNNFLFNESIFPQAVFVVSMFARSEGEVFRRDRLTKEEGETLHSLQTLPGKIKINSQHDIGSMSVMNRLLSDRGPTQWVKFDFFRQKNWTFF